jgi:ATP-dependent RNA helicase DDX55/SPB4
VCTDIMARGIDIEDVDWVVQYDSPKLASQFVHRCGRTARSGREGNALIILLPNEDCYVKFILINQQVPLQKLDLDLEEKNKKSDSLIKQIRDFAIKERYFFSFSKLKLHVFYFLIVCGFF